MCSGTCHSNQGEALNILDYKDLAVPLATIIGALLGALTTRSSTLNSRSRLKADVEIMSKLEAGSEAHTALEEHVKWQIKRLTWYEQKDKFRLVMKLFLFINFIFYIIAFSIDKATTDDPAGPSFAERMIAFFVLIGISYLIGDLYAERFGRSKRFK